MLTLCLAEASPWASWMYGWYTRNQNQMTFMMNERGAMKRVGKKDCGEDDDVREKLYIHDSERDWTYEKELGRDVSTERKYVLLLHSKACSNTMTPSDTIRRACINR
jgi:hypothetical protein